MLSQAVILAGGMGKRLGTVTSSIPKPMISIGGKPFLQFIVEHLRDNGFKEIVITVGYLSSIIKDYFGDGAEFGVSIKYIEEDSPCGTAGALLLGKQMLDDEFLVVNGDTIFDINLWDLYKLFSERNATAAVALRKVHDVSRYGAVEISDNIIKSFSEKSSTGVGLISGGVYIFNKRAINLLVRVPAAVEQDIFPQLIEKFELVGKCYDSFFIDIGIPETLNAAKQLVPKWWCKPIAFLDKDGVLNVNHGYVASKERHEWVDEAVSAVKYLNEMGYRVVLVTNQAGIGRGYYSEEEFLSYISWVSETMKKGGAHFDAIRYCPHHPTHAKAPYLMECACRKPSPGMLLDVINSMCVDLERSFLIGDKLHDIEAANAAGIQGYLYEGSIDLLRFAKNITNHS